MDEQNENYLSRRHMCVFANRRWNLNKVKNKLKCIHRGDVRVIQQPVISCWAPYGVAPALISNGKCVFQSSSHCRSLGCCSANTRKGENPFRGFHLVSEITSTFIEHTHDTILVKCQTFIGSDMIRDNYMNGDRAGHTIFTQDELCQEQ